MNSLITPLRQEWQVTCSFKYKTTYDFKQKAPWDNNFHAIEQAMAFSKACDITGIIAVACAWHGCFSPNSIVNIFRGEKQSHVDFSLIHALLTTFVDPDQSAMLIYNIVCQYFIYLYERFGHLLPASLILDHAIGLFHVHGHKYICFFRYAPTFIPGTGIVAGEILESLWVNLNTITPSMRMATLDHHAEMIDDHANNSNYKKMLGMGKLQNYLCSSRKIRDL